MWEKKEFGFLLLFCLTSFLFLGIPVVYGAGEHFINVTSSGFYSIWINCTTVNDRFLDNDTYYYGLHMYSNATTDAEASPTGASQTHHTTIFVQGAGFGTFWTYFTSLGYKVRFSDTAFVTGNSGEDGLNTGLFLFLPYGTDFEITNKEECSEDPVETNYRYWVFAEEKYYHFKCTYTMNSSFISPVWESLDEVKIGFTDGVNQINATYDVDDEEFSLDSGSDVVRLKAGTVQNTSSSVLEVTFDFFLESDIIDAQNITVQLYAVSDDGFTGGWTEMDEFPFYIYSAGGLAEYRQWGDTTTSGKIARGDVFELEIPWTASDGIQANLTYRKLQHTRMLMAVSLNTSRIGQTYAGDWYAEYGVYYCVHGRWVKGWYAKIEHSSGINTIKDHWIKIHVRWYRGQGTMVGESDYFYSFWEPEPEKHTTLWVDLWFNSVNASSVGGGRVSAEYYGMQEATAWWQFWYTDWGPLLSNKTESMYFEDLLDENGEIVSTKEITMVKVYAKLAKPESVGYYPIQLRDYDVFDKTFAEGDFVGVDTPAVVPAKVMDMPQGGLFGVILDGLKRVTDAITMGVLWMWDTFVGFLDTIASWMGFPNGFSNFLAWITSFWAWTTSAFTNIISVMTTIFSIITGPLVTFITYFVSVFTGVINFITVMTGIVTGTYTWSEDIITKLDAASWVTLFTSIILPLWVFGAFEKRSESRGLQGIWDRINLLLDIAMYFVRIGISIIQLFLKLLTTVIESIPVAE